MNQLMGRVKCETWGFYRVELHMHGGGTTPSLPNTWLEAGLEAGTVQPAIFALLANMPPSHAWAT